MDKLTTQNDLRINNKRTAQLAVCLFSKVKNYYQGGWEMKLWSLFSLSVSGGEKEKHSPSLKFKLCK